jgi:hypothetical protein
MKAVNKTEIDVVKLLQIMKDSWRLSLVVIFICQAVTWLFLEYREDRFTSKIFLTISNVQPLHHSLQGSQELTLLDFKESFRDQTNVESWLEVNPASILKMADMTSENKFGQVTVNDMDNGLLTVLLRNGRAHVLVKSSDPIVLQEAKNYADHVNHLMTERAVSLIKKVDGEMLASDVAGQNYNEQFSVKTFINNLESGQQILDILHPTIPQNVGQSKALISVLSGLASIVVLLLFLAMRSLYRDLRETVPR